MDQNAEDLSVLIETLDLNNLTMVDHSIGGGEVAHYLGRYGTKRVSKAVLLGAAPPLMLKTPENLEDLEEKRFSGKSLADIRALQFVRCKRAPPEPR